MNQTPTFEMDGNNLVLLENTKFKECLIVMGNITCKNGRYSLTVYGEIYAENIDVRDIRAGNIYANNISADDINAGNITPDDIIARNIDADDIIRADHIRADHITAYDIEAETILCETRTKKTPEAKTIARTLTLNTHSLEFKEQMSTTQTNSKQWETPS